MHCAIVMLPTRYCIIIYYTHIIHTSMIVKFEKSFGNSIIILVYKCTVIPVMHNYSY